MMYATSLTFFHIIFIIWNDVHDLCVTIRNWFQISIHIPFTMWTTSSVFREKLKERKERKKSPHWTDEASGWCISMIMARIQSWIKSLLFRLCMQVVDVNTVLLVRPGVSILYLKQLHVLSPLPSMKRTRRAPFIYLSFENCGGAPLSRLHPQLWLKATASWLHNRPDWPQLVWNL